MTIRELTRHDVLGGAAFSVCGSGAPAMAVPYSRAVVWRKARILLWLTVGMAMLSPVGASASDDARPYLSLKALRAKYADQRGHIAKIDGVEVYYKDEGAGPVILMVHGSVSTLKTYDRVAAKLTNRYRVIRYDIPPGGLSGPVSDEAAAMLKPTDIAEKLLERLGVKKVTFVGVSIGGTLGVQLAAKRPDLVQRLILANTPADPVVTTHMVQPPAFIKEQAEAKRTGFKSQAFWNSYLDYFSGDSARLSADVRRQYYDMNRRIPEKHPLALVAMVADHAAAVQAMSHVTAPTLLIWGGRDSLLTPPSADVLAAYLTHAQVSKVIMRDVGHYPPLEAPERFAEIVAAYIEAVTPGAS